MVKIASSFLSADFRFLEQEIRKVEDAGVDYIHLDVMDGHFVPNLTFGPIVIDAIRKETDLLLDVHLMMTNPENYIQVFAESGADILSVHQEISTDIGGLLTKIREMGIKSGVSVKPNTSEKILFPFLPTIDMVLVMSVEPGFGGQAFLPDSVSKVCALKAEIERQELGTEIEIDGGIGIDNARQVVMAGVDVIVAGSSIFRNGKVAKNVLALRRAIKGD